MRAEEWYQAVSKQMTMEGLDRLARFYQHWEGQQVLDLKFRFIKILARTENDPLLKWYLFHQLVNKRRITCETFPELLRNIIDEGTYPVRIFQSTTEWLSPHDVWRSTNARIIRSGFVPLENDDDLETSLKTARDLQPMVGDAKYIYSGNKSIHVWKYIDPKFKDEQLAYADLREKAERNYRYYLFSKIQKKTPYILDNRISADPRRVVPMINTLNGLTGRLVVEIDSEEISTISPDDIINRSQVL